MIPLTVNCFGQFAVTVDDQPITAFRTDKVRALLPYLVLEERPHRREALAMLLWPDTAEEEEHLAHCEERLARLVQAAALYQGELLAGFALPNAPAFEEWLGVRREAFHQQMIALLFDLAVAYDARGELAQAQQAIQRLLTLAPWRGLPWRKVIAAVRRGKSRRFCLFSPNNPTPTTPIGST